MSDHDSIAAYALGALPDDERVEFEAHLAGCEGCRHELAELRVAADALPVAVEQLSAPPALKARIMATVNSEAQLLAAAGAGADRPAAAPAAQPRRSRWAWRPALALAAAVACVAGAGVTAGLVASGGDDATTVVAAAAPRGATVEMQVREEHSTLVARDLPAPPAGRVYQVWIKRPGADPAPTDALFTTREGKASVDVPGSMEGVEAVLVTHEPKGGSRAPTTQPIIAVRPA